MFDLTGMTALVTGASGGIGSAIARGLAAHGARLALSGSNEAKLKDFAASLGGDHVVLTCNLSDPAAVDALVPQAVDLPGSVLQVAPELGEVTTEFGGGGVGGAGSLDGCIDVALGAVAGSPHGHHHDDQHGDNRADDHR